MNRTSSLLALLLGGCAPLSAPSGTDTLVTDTFVCDATELGTLNPGHDTCLDMGDADGDGLRNCDDDDADGDGLRNTWDAGALDFNVRVGPAEGFGTDGALTLANGETRTLAPATRLTRSSQAGEAELSVSDADALRLSGESLVGAELLVLVLQGPNAGRYQTVFVASEQGSTLTVEPALAFSLHNTETVAIQRVPHYSAVEIGAGATLRPEAWTDGGTGVLALRVAGALTVRAGGRIDASGAGFAGGAGALSAHVMAEPGESWDQADALREGENNKGGGGGGPLDPDEAVCGAGGSFGSIGENGYGWNDEDGLFATAGAAYGDTLQAGWYLGSGGGGGSFDPDSNGSSASESGAGGAGGGFVMIFAYGGLHIDGEILVQGDDGGDATSTRDELGGGGGGAGGQALLVSTVIDGDGAVRLDGGRGGQDIVCGRSGCNRLNRGGDGGQGRLRLDADTLGGGLTTIGVSYKPGNTSAWPWSITPVGGHCDTDADGDGFIDAACGGDDCSDDDGAVHPGATEQPDDGIDADCDGAELCTSEGGSVHWIQGQD